MVRRLFAALVMAAGRLFSSIRRPPPVVERAALVVASIGMLIAAWLTIRSGRIDPDQLRWGPLVIAAVIGVPAAVAMNAMEFWCSAWATGTRLGWRRALRTTILATAANLLPLPGGPLVRIHALQRVGTGLGRAGQVTAGIGVIWVGVAALVAGGGAAAAGATAGLVVGALLAAASLLGAGVLMLVRASADGRRLRSVVGVLTIEAVSVLVSAARLWLVLLALGEPGTLPMVLVLAVAGVLATAVGIVPAGLGVREGLSALLAEAVGLPAALGFLASLVDRVLGLVVVAPVGLWLASRRAAGTETRA
ncbi:MAG: flippase-like domain-containing protein [Nitriliruptoraceae bacterium]|nr:flippase-like domain-containing protein [Nitriliruptoraceae bacterium]